MIRIKSFLKDGIYWDYKMNLEIFGLILNFIGSFILILITLFGKWHQTVYGNHWTKRYWWMGRRPLWKNTETHKWHFKWNHVVVVQGFIPPNHLWNSIGFLLIALGFIFQLVSI
jgi:hypothetical protein